MLTETLLYSQNFRFNNQTYSFSRLTPDGITLNQFVSNTPLQGTADFPFGLAFAGNGGNSPSLAATRCLATVLGSYLTTIGWAQCNSAKVCCCHGVISKGVEEYSHAGLPAFRVGGRKFASLASQAEGYGNLMLTLEQQAAFVEEAPKIFLPITGGWGRMGHTHIRLAAASKDVLTGALQTAWKLRIEKNAGTGRKAKKRHRSIRTSHL